MSHHSLLYSLPTPCYISCTPGFQTHTEKHLSRKSPENEATLSLFFPVWNHRFSPVKGMLLGFLIHHRSSHQPCIAEALFQAGIAKRTRLPFSIQHPLTEQKLYPKHERPSILGLHSPPTFTQLHVLHKQNFHVWRVKLQRQGIDSPPSSSPRPQYPLIQPGVTKIKVDLYPQFQHSGPGVLPRRRGRVWDKELRRSA